MLAKSDGDAPGLQKTREGKQEVEEVERVSEVKAEIDGLLDDLEQLAASESRPIIHVRDTEYILPGDHCPDQGDSKTLRVISDLLEEDKKLKEDLFTVSPARSTEGPKAPKSAKRDKPGGLVCYGCGKEGHKRNQCSQKGRDKPRSVKSAGAIAASVKDCADKADSLAIVVADLRDENRALREEAREKPKKEDIEIVVNDAADEFFQRNMQGLTYVEPLNSFRIYGRLGYNFLGPVMWVVAGVVAILALLLPFTPLLYWIMMMYLALALLAITVVSDLFLKTFISLKAMKTRRRYSEDDPFRTNMDSHLLSPHEVFHWTDMLNPISLVLAMLQKFPSDYVRAKYHVKASALGETFEHEVEKPDTRPQCVRSNKITNNDPHLTIVKVEVVTDSSTISETELEVYGTFIRELTASSRYSLMYEGRDLSERIAQAIMTSMNQVNFMAGENAYRRQPIFESTHILACVIIQHLRAKLPQTNFDPTLVRVVSE